MRRHGVQTFYIPDEGVLGLSGGQPVCSPPTDTEAATRFRFSRMRPARTPDDLRRPSLELLNKLATAMIQETGTERDGSVPAGFTYLGQFVDHDLTRDDSGKKLGQDEPVERMVQGRSPALDLDSLYGAGPDIQPQFYDPDGVHLKQGHTTPATFPVVNPTVTTRLDGFDIPRVGVGDLAASRQPNIPDARNDENLAVAQLHAAFIRFHNRVVDRLAGQGATGRGVFDRARESVTKHYQWMLRQDFLPRIIDPDVLNRVFTEGRRFFEKADPPQNGTMPVEFSVAAFRLGHSMIGQSYEWNAVFESRGQQPPASLAALFNFSGVSGTLSPPGKEFVTLPSNWVVDWGRMFQLPGALAAPPTRLNMAQRIGTLLVNPLKALPSGAIRDPGGKMPHASQINLAYRNLVRGWMVRLPSGQQMANLFGAPPLTDDEILYGDGARIADTLNATETQELLRATPLWFYVLREAEASGQGRLGPVGSTIVAETFHRAIETSPHSIIQDAGWRPDIESAVPGSFTMADLLTFAFEGKRELVSPLG